MKSTRLPTNGGALVLALGDWCEVSVDVERRSIVLGADARRTVVERLRNMLRVPSLDTASESVTGLDVVWVTSFSERHCSLYAGDTDDGRRLLFQDEKGATVAELTLTAEDRAEWLRLLESPTVAGKPKSVIQVDAPSSTKSLQLMYVGEIRFGPPYHSVKAVGFRIPLAPSALVGGARWTPDGHVVVLTVFHRIDSSSSPDMELVGYDLATGQVHSLARETKLIEILSLTNTSVTARVGAQDLAFSLTPSR